jgi:hypothetical protein
MVGTMALVLVERMELWSVLVLVLLFVLVVIVKFMVVIIVIAETVADVEKYQYKS